MREVTVLSMEQSRRCFQTIIVLGLYESTHNIVLGSRLHHALLSVRTARANLLLSRSRKNVISSHKRLMFAAYILGVF